MSVWRREAIARFPELRREIADVEGAKWIWFELWYSLFQPAYSSDPPNWEAIARTYDYAYWCLAHRSAEVRSAVILDFFEMLPNDSLMRRDMPRWISQADFDMLHFAWEYATKQEFAELRQEFIANKTRIEKEERTKGILWHNIPSS